MKSRHTLTAMFAAALAAFGLAAATNAAEINSKEVAQKADAQVNHTLVVNTGQPQANESFKTVSPQQMLTTKVAAATQRANAPMSVSFRLISAKMISAKMHDAAFDPRTAAQEIVLSHASQGCAVATRVITMHQRDVPIPSVNYMAVTTLAFNSGVITA